MKVVILSDSQAAAANIAQHIIDRINSFAPTDTRPYFVLGLPTGSSPLPIYRLLVDAYRVGTVSFRNVVTFNMDEYVDLEQTHPESYHSFMFTNFFNHVDVQPQNINILNGNAADLDEECARYEDKIQAAGGIDLFLGGVGRDGHIAFNEPGSSLVSRTRVEVLAQDTIHANARFFGGDLSLVPTRALTVGVQTVMDAREVVIIATGAQKASAVRNAIEGGVSQMCTLSCLQLHPNGIVVVDEDAALELKYATVKYFKSLGDLSTLNISKHQRHSVLPRTKLCATPPQTPDSKSYLEDDELTPDRMSSRIMTWPLAARPF
ncbi:glucosamine-6-phosphate deaminase [Exophiala spinifera]|uniref:Glucosamine-6-phosphate isomerase n=1 Tax=Exophiala spinifera TaxID=91928 RepID=A0A0D2B5P0_9EURO|nr:glucosamine-6-phosphate deaminase [Exophiala spinifera]KIW14253.1 glucosamine-6-phosphate deaminase [Exophiala spinifera]